MAAGAVFSLFMSTIAAGAMLLPAAVQAGRDSNVRPSKLLIPLAFGTLAGGMATYFTGAHIIVADIDAGLAHSSATTLNDRHGSGTAHSIELDVRVVHHRSTSTGSE